MSTNFAKTLVWKQDYDVILWRHKQRTPNTNDYPMPLNETPPWKVSAYGTARKQTFALKLYPEPQCSFLWNRSTQDIVFLRQIQKYREQRCPLHINFVDLTKVFDMVSRDLAKKPDFVRMFWFSEKAKCVKKARISKSGFEKAKLANLFGKVYALWGDQNPIILQTFL